MRPVESLRLRARVYGVRYPRSARERLEQAGIEYCGWLPNFRVPEIFARYRVTVHIPRAPYARALRGIPTIRPFEALACRIPLVCAPWENTENLFRPGRDYLRDGEEMRRHLRTLLGDDRLAEENAGRGMETVRARHTRVHRADHLMEICREARE